MQIIETVFREAHSLKGAARAVGVAEIESICQAAGECVLGAQSARSSTIRPGLFDVLHDAVDALSKAARDRR